MTFYEATEVLGLPQYARWTMYSHAEQDAIAKLTGEMAPYQRQADEDARFIRRHYTHPDFVNEWKNYPLVMNFKTWLHEEIKRCSADTINIHMERRSRTLAKFRLLRLKEALCTIG